MIDRVAWKWTKQPRTLEVEIVQRGRTSEDVVAGLACQVLCSAFPDVTFELVELTPSRIGARTIWRSVAFQSDRALPDVWLETKVD